MANLILLVLSSLAGLRTQAAMKAEIIALRHQLIVLQRSRKTKRLILRRADRWLCVWLSRWWSGWRSALIIVKPETVLRWHRKGFRCYWTWKICHGRRGRPTLQATVAKYMVRHRNRHHQLGEPSSAITMRNLYVGPLAHTSGIATGPAFTCHWIKTHDQSSLSAKSSRFRNSVAFTAGTNDEPLEPRMSVAQSRPRQSRSGNHRADVNRGWG
jgi:hypothetical protein